MMLLMKPAQSMMGTVAVLPYKDAFDVHLTKLTVVSGKQKEQKSELVFLPAAQKDNMD